MSGEVKATDIQYSLVQLVLSGTYHCTTFSRILLWVSGLGGGF